MSVGLGSDQSDLRLTWPLFSLLSSPSSPNHLTFTGVKHGEGVGAEDRLPRNKCSIISSFPGGLSEVYVCVKGAGGDDSGRKGI